MPFSRCKRRERACLPEHHDRGNVEWVRTAPRINVKRLGEQLGIGLGDEFVYGVRLSVVRVALLSFRLGRRQRIFCVRDVHMPVQNVKRISTSGHFYFRKS